MDNNRKFRPFGIRDSIAYALGDLGCNMSFALKSTMSIFWTQFMGMDLWYALLLIVVQVWDAINDPLIGSIIDADRRQYKRNKFLAYIWAGSIGLIVGGACCFLPFPNAPTWAKFIIFIAGYVVWDAFYTVANVPYGSLLSLISNDVKDRWVPHSATSLKKSAAVSPTARSLRQPRQAVLRADVSPHPLSIRKLTTTTSLQSAV